MNYVGYTEILQTGAGTPTALAYTGVGINDDLDGTGDILTAAWTNGVTSFDVNYPVANEPITFTIINGTSNDTQAITWQVGVLDHFYIQVWDTTPMVGNAAWVLFTAKDAGNNTITTHTGASPDILESIGDLGPALPTWAGDCFDTADGNAIILPENC